MSRQSVRLRPVDLVADRTALARLDLSFQAHRIFVVHRRATGFDLIEEASSPPIERRYVVEWAELSQSVGTVVAEQGGHIVGVAVLGITDWNRRGTVAHLYVDRQSRGMGIGTQLVAALERAGTARGIRALWVETQNVNVAAIRFYQSCGFELCGLDMSLYDPAAVANETAIYLSRSIESPVGTPGDGEAKGA